MATKRNRSTRAFSAVALFCLLFSQTEIQAVFASTDSRLEEPQVTPLTATLDESVHLESFPATAPFIVHFSEPMDPESSVAPILAYPYREGQSAWNAASNTLTFTPSKPLQPGATFLFFLDPALRAKSGAVFDTSPQWSVQVAQGVQIVGVAPQAGLLTSRRPAIQVTFNRLMDRVRTEKSLSIQPNTPFKIKWINDTTLQINPDALLLRGQQYTLTFAGGPSENAALAQDGSPLVQDYNWTYWLDPLSIKIPAAEQKMVQVKFSQRLDTEATGFPFAITPPLKGKWQWYEKTTATFLAEEAIPAGQLFNLTIDGPLMDAEGEIPVIESSFQFAAPVIEKVEPTNTDTVSANSSTIKITFLVPVNKESAEKAVTISPPTDGRFSWQKEEKSSFDNTLMFSPSSRWKLGTPYTVSIAPTLRSPQGNALMAEPYQWDFTTQYYEDFYNSPATFGSGTKVQVVDIVGPRRVQFSSDEKELVTFEAYRYDLIDFAALYADYRSGKGLPRPALDREKEPIATWNYWEVNPKYQETIIPPQVPPGLYVLNMKYGGQDFDQLFVALTSNTIVAKKSGDELFVWLTNINGNNVAEAEIRLYSDQGEKIREGKTDENGFYRVALPDGYTPMLVAARTGKNNGDVTISGLDEAWQEGPSGYWDRVGEGSRYLAYIYTDRPIYRPGQTVNFKAVIRRDKDAKYELPETNLAVTIEVRDAKHNLLQSSNLTTNEFGTVNGSFTTVEGAVLGDYEIETVIDGERSSQIFKVQDYRKPDIKVTLSRAPEGQSNKFVDGDKFDLKIDTQYLFGEPVAKAGLSFKLYHLYPQYNGWWDGPSSDEVTYSWFPLDGLNLPTQQADMNGQAQVTIPARFDDNSYYSDYDDWRSSLRLHTYAVEVTASDGSDQPVSSSYIFNVYNASHKISLDTEGYLKPANKPFTITAHLTTLEDQPVADRELHLQIRNWDSKSYQFSNVFETDNLQTDEDGIAQRQLRLQPGYYQLLLTGRDDNGNSIEYSRSIRVLAALGTPWESTSWDAISISANQDEYKPYQTARFAIESSVSGPALLTFERGHVIHTKLITLTAPLTVVEAEIIPEDAPNVFVTVNAWGAVTPPLGEEVEYYRRNIPDSQMLIATTELQVSAEANALQISLATDRQTYHPGDQVTVNIDVKDNKGQPVDAEVSLALVDEAIFSLSNELAPNIFSAFYGPRKWSVSTFTSMTPVRVIYDGGGRGGGGDSFLPIEPRMDFRDTAAWFPALRTDSQGHVTVTLDVPDNLTSWRLSAKAITLNHLVGQTESHIETKKDLFLRPVLPRILTTGDQAQLTTMLHNYSNTDQIVQVTLKADGLKINNDATQSVIVKAGDVAAIGWNVIPETTQETNITITASGDNSLGDSISLPLPIQPLAFKDIHSISGNFNGGLTLTLPVVPDLLPEASAVTLKLSRTAASTVLNGLEYLTGYPYGCVEQTMSRALPNAVLGNASAQLGVGGEELKARVEPLIQASIQKLYGYQHNDGGWGWWYDDRSDEYQTAWVLHGLSIIRDAGYFIEPQVLQKGSEYLEGHLHEMNVRTRAYSLYSLAKAGHGTVENAQNLMTESLNELDPFSQAALAMTLHQQGDDQGANEILDLLEKSSIHKDSLTYWPQSSSDGEYHRKTMSSTIRTTAMVLSAWMEIRGESPLTEEVANYLMKNRTGYGWGTTNETSFTILALTDYLSGQQEQSGSSDFTVELNGRPITTGVLEAGNLFSTIVVPLEQLQVGANSIKLSTSGSAPLYYDIVSSFTTPTMSMKAAGNIELERRYLDPKTNKPVESLVKGQLVKVELGVQMPENASFVIVEDHLPGGLEALNENLNSTTQDTINYEYDYYEEMFFWQDYGYNYKEIHGDRVSFFMTEFMKGATRLTYYARATVSGVFTALPAEAYAMYDSQTWGRSSSATVNVLP